jgi:RNA polymerase sigma factor (sigma-70 family)
MIGEPKVMSDIKEASDMVCAPPQDEKPEPPLSPAARMLALYEAHAASVARYAAGLCGNPQVAMEATQQAFLELVQTRTEEPPAPWLYHRVSEILAERGAAAPAQALAPPPKSDDSAELMAWVASQEVLARLRNRLSPREFEILVLRLDGSSYTQISKALDISIGTVASTLARAVKKARNLLAEEKG